MHKHFVWEKQQYNFRISKINSYKNCTSFLIIWWLCGLKFLFFLKDYNKDEQIRKYDAVTIKNQILEHGLNFDGMAKYTYFASPFVNIDFDCILL